MLQVLKAFWADEEGAAAIEYALIAALIAVAIVVGAGILGTNINDIFTALGNYLGILEAKVPK
jgi:pilus assembly protein Flp/PilA